MNFLLGILLAGGFVKATVRPQTIQPMVEVALGHHSLQTLRAEALSSAGKVKFQISLIIEGGVQSKALISKSEFDNLMQLIEQLLKTVPDIESIHRGPCSEIFEITINKKSNMDSRFYPLCLDRGSSRLRSQALNWWAKASKLIYSRE